ncbi:MAG: nuclear transport factor 2 family protein [Spirosomataceae bacterium]
MKNTLLILLTLFSISTFAQSKDEVAVGKAVEFLKNAMVSGNRTDLESIAANELTYGHSNGLIEDKTQFVEAIASGKSDFVTINLSDQTIRIVGNTALVRHKLAAETNNGGVAGSTRLSILLVFQKQKGAWKLLARQAVKIP